MAVTISGSSPTFSSGYQGGTIISGTAVASTSGTSIDFTSIPSWVKRVTVVFSSVSNSGQPLIQLGTSGGVVATGYNQGGWYSTAGGGFSSTTTGFALSGSTYSGAALWSGSYIFTLVGSNTWAGQGCFFSGGTTIYALCSGSVPLGAALTTIRATSVGAAGTFSAGTINILYE